jgi:hypothetical protein
MAIALALIIVVLIGVLVQDLDVFGLAPAMADCK